MALKPERRMHSVSTPAAMPRGWPRPPTTETPPTMAAAAAGASTSESATGEAAPRL